MNHGPYCYRHSEGTTDGGHSPSSRQTSVYATSGRGQCRRRWLDPQGGEDPPSFGEKVELSGRSVPDHGGESWGGGFVRGVRVPCCGGRQERVGGGRDSGVHDDRGTVVKVHEVPVCTSVHVYVRNPERDGVTSSECDYDGHIRDGGDPYALVGG